MKKTTTKKQTTKTTTTAKPNRKQTIIDLISRAKGATLAELMQSTGWQAHSVRGMISTLGSKHGLKIASSKNDEGERTYSRRAQGQGEEARRETRSRSRSSRVASNQHQPRPGPKRPGLFPSEAARCPRSRHVALCGASARRDVTRIADAALDAADVRAVQTSAPSQFFLRPLPLGPARARSRRTSCSAAESFSESHSVYHGYHVCAGGWLRVYSRKVTKSSQLFDSISDAKVSQKVDSPTQSRPRSRTVALCGVSGRADVETSVDDSAAAQGGANIIVLLGEKRNAPAEATRRTRTVGDLLSSPSLASRACPRTASSRRLRVHAADCDTRPSARRRDAARRRSGDCTSPASCVRRDRPTP